MYLYNFFSLCNGANHIKMKETVFIDSAQDEGSWIDVVLFDLLTAVTILFTLSNITLEGGIALDNANAQNAFFAIPALIVFTFLAITFILRNKDRKGKGNTKLFLILFSVFALFKLIFMFSYPYGEVEYTFTRIGTGDEINVVYDGLSSYNRWVDTLCDIGICAYFMILFSYMNTLGQKGHINTFVLLLLMIGVGITVNITSYVTDGDLYAQNCSYLFGLSDADSSISINGMLDNKNQLAFFNNIAMFAAIIIFCKKPNPFSIILSAYFMITTIIVLARIASIISIITCFSVLIVFPIFNFKRHRGYSIFCIAFDVVFVLLVCILYFAGNKAVVTSFNAFISNLKYDGNVSARIERMKIGLSMLLDSPYAFIFGYGSNASAGIFAKYYLGIGWGVQSTNNAHNGILQTWLDFGLVGLLLCLAGVVYLIYMSVRIGRTKGNGCLGIMYVIIVLMCIVHSSLEPRFIFLDEGSPILFIVSVIFPIYNDYYRYVVAPHAKIDSSKKELVFGLG